MSDCKEKLTAEAYGDGRLDEIVYTVTDGIASAVNNEGFKGQLAFLKEHGWTEEAILEWLRED